MFLVQARRQARGRRNTAHVSAAGAADSRQAQRLQETATRGVLVGAPQGAKTAVE